MMFKSCHFLVMTVLTIITYEGHSSACGLVKLEHIPNYLGLYFVPQYWFSISSETWNVIYNLPLQPLEDRINLITKVWNEIEKSRQQKNWIYTHEPRLDLIKHSWLKLNHLYDQLGHLLLHKYRTKRGLFDSLGKVVKFITGNMDADDGSILQCKNKYNSFR